MSRFLSFFISEKIELYIKIFTCSKPPEEIENILFDNFTDLLTGKAKTLNPNAAALLTTAPKLFVSWIWSHTIKFESLNLLISDSL